MVLVRWLWFGWPAFRGLRPPALFFFQVSSRKPSIRPISCTDFAGSLLETEPQVMSLFGAAPPILQAASVGDYTFCREFVKVILTGQSRKEPRRFEAIDSSRVSR